MASASLSVLATWREAKGARQPNKKFLISRPSAQLKNFASSRLGVGPKERVSPKKCSRCLKRDLAAWRLSVEYYSQSGYVKGLEC